MPPMDYYSSGLASPWRRLMASGVDLAILAIPITLMSAPELGWAKRWFEPAILQRLPLVGMVGLIGFAILNLYLLKSRSQTPGKILFDLRIEVDMSRDEAVPDFFIDSETRIDAPAAIRYIPFLFAGLIAILFPSLSLVAVVVIVAPMFGNARRGFHDYFGSSRVVDIDAEDD